MLRRSPRPTLFPYTTLFRSERHRREHVGGVVFFVERLVANDRPAGGLDHFDVQSMLAVEAHWVRHDDGRGAGDRDEADLEILLDRKSTRLNSSHMSISYAVF